MVDALPNIDFLMSLFLPWDVRPQVAYLEQFSALLMNTVKPVLFLSPACDDIRAWWPCWRRWRGARRRYARSRGALCYINVTHPFRHEHDDVEKLLFLAEKAVPFTYNPAVLRGRERPHHAAGAMAAGNAGELFGLVLSQLVSEGCPATLSGGTADKLDMRTMIDVYSAPENRVASRRDGPPLRPPALRPGRRLGFEGRRRAERGRSVALPSGRGSGRLHPRSTTWATWSRA